MAHVHQGLHAPGTSNGDDSDSQSLCPDSSFGLEVT
jgi:hypothetical protein